ncbi:GH19910 [Drosophila grimshawi]|uniref:GH19910 n=1 Tax=Drosophila grimshawi TaxID=7222 RepID=B4J8W7_DROGR|nr:GH19910 [Drosophila grimshawi]
MLVSGADDVVRDIKQQSDEMGKRGSIFVEAPRASRRRSFYNFFLRHQDAVDDSLTSPSVHRKTAMNTNTTTSTSTSASASVSASATNVESDKQAQHQQQVAPTPTRKRASSFIRKKPPLERGLSAQSALRVNKNAFVSEGPAPEVIVTKPSPDQQTHPHVHALGLRPDNATLVHVLVHRESEEYKDEDESSPSSPVHSSTNGNGMDKQRPPQIRISSSSSEIAMDSCLLPTVQIMVDSPKEPPRGDFSTDSGFPNAAYAPTTVDVDAPIDVNVQGDTSQVFYDYNPEESNLDNTNDIVPIEELPQSLSEATSAAAAAAAIDEQQR